jgi:NAD(P)-dependent dehydrogenase (short-subunit alcohol dehydrogenase family)
MKKNAVIITGAGGGIGRALCNVFKRSGYFVIGTDRVKTLSAVDHYIRLDFSDAKLETKAKIFSKIIKARNLNLVALINNAAVQILGPSQKLSSADWEMTMKVNVLAPALLTRLLYADLLRGEGSVLNIASIHSTLTKPGFAAYATSKAALVGMTKALAVDVGSKIRVNCLCPAAITTPMLLEGFRKNKSGLAKLAKFHPVEKLGTPEEVAALALMVCSKKMNFLNGAILNLDGGIAGRLYDPA